MTIDKIMEIVGVLFAVGMLILFLAFIWKIWTDKIDISTILEEPPKPPVVGPAKASLARLQLLLFTIVVAGLYAILSIKAQTFVDVPENVLGLIGISGGSFLISKGIGK